MNKHEEIPFSVHMTKTQKFFLIVHVSGQKIELEFKETVHFIFTFSYI